MSEASTTGVLVVLELQDEVGPNVAVTYDYNDVWNVQDYRFQGATEGPNCMNVDPLYVNNTTAPYDYQLQSTSPVLGEGKLGVDMGCYGNLAAGDTVGLLTPQ